MYVSGPAGSIPFYGYSVDGAISAYTVFNSSNDSWDVVGASGAIGLRLTAENTVVATNDIQAESFQYESPKLHYYSVSGAQFISGSGSPFRSVHGAGDTFLTPSTAGGSGYLVAPVNLPHNATITRVRFYYNDTVASSLSMALRRRMHASGNISLLATASSTGQNGSNLQSIDSSISGSQVDNNTYGYHLWIHSNSWSSNITLSIKSVVIEYTTTQAD